MPYRAKNTLETQDINEREEEEDEQDEEEGKDRAKHRSAANIMRRGRIREDTKDRRN